MRDYIQGFSYEIGIDNGRWHSLSIEAQAARRDAVLELLADMTYLHANLEPVTDAILATLGLGGAA